MSAYVVDHECINEIVTYAMHDPYLRHAIIETTPEELGAAMLAMNKQAVMARYRDCTEDNLPGPINPPPYVFEFVPASAAQVYKSLSCYLYQCTEGHVPEQSLYKSLDNMQSHVAESIISRLPEYKQAKWH